MIAIMRDGMGVGLAATQLGMLRRLLVFQAGPDSEPTALVNPVVEWLSDDDRPRRGGLPQPAAGLDGRRAPAARAGQRPRRRGRAGRDRGLRPRGAGAPARDRPPRRRADPRPHPRDQRKGALRALREGGSYSPPVEDEDEHAAASFTSRAPTREHGLPRHLGLRRDGPARLAASPHRPQLVVTPPDRPRGGGAGPCHRRSPRRPASWRSTCSRPRTSTTRRRWSGSAPPAGGGGRLRLRPADPRAAALRAADAQRPSLAAAALARGGADRAGDHGRRRPHRRLRDEAHRGARLGPGGPARGDPDRCRGRLRGALREARRARRRAAGQGARPRTPRGGWSSRSRTRTRRPTPRRSTPPSAASTPPGRRPSWPRRCGR